MEEAERAYQTVLLLHPRHPHAWNLLGQLYLESGNPSSAFHTFQIASQLDPRDPYIHYHLGLLHQLLQTPTHAIAEYKLACKLRPYDTHLRVALGEAFLDQHEVDKAIECYLLAESLGDTEGVCSRRLGDLYMRKEDRLRSAYFYQRYLKKRKFVICDADTYHCAIALCQFYKKEGKKSELIHMCNILLTSADEGAQREARNLLACTLYSCLFGHTNSMHSYYARVNTVFFTTVYSLAIVGVFYGIL